MPIAESEIPAMVQLNIAKNLSVAPEKLFAGHVGIAGQSGVGKSRNVAAKLLAECLKKQPTAPNGVPYAYLVVDTNDEYVGFLDLYPDRVVVFSPDASRGIPFRISSRNITIDELTVFFKEVTKKELSKAELATIYLAIDELRAKGDYTLEQLFTRLYELEAYAVLPAFEKMMATNIFAPDETPLTLLARPGQASVIAIGGYSTEVQAIIVAHLVRALFLARKNNQVGPIVTFLEECSVFAPEGELAPSSDVLKTLSTQGRGYHFILVNIFQRSSLTSKNVLSQIGSWFIGKTGNPMDRHAILRSAEKIESEHDRVIKNLESGKDFLVTGFIVDEPLVVTIPDQKILLSKGGRVKPTAIEAAFKREDMTDWVAKIRSLEEAERRRMEDTISRLRAEREEKTRAPIVPKKTQRELDRVKRDLGQLQERYQKALEALKVKEKAADRKARERYEARVKELEAEVERLTRQVAIGGAAREEKAAWEQDIVKQRLKPLSDKQRDLVIFLERVGPSAAEKIAPTLGVAPKTVTVYVSEINKQIHGLIAFDDRKGVYYSRLTEIFPISRGASSSDEIERTRAELNSIRSDLDAAKTLVNARSDELAALKQERASLLEQLGKQQSGAASPEAHAVLQMIKKRLARLVQAIKSAC